MARGERSGGGLTSSDNHCAGVVRSGDRDRYLATLFAPASARAHLHALHAFAVELAVVRSRVSEALAGELRLQWWRDSLDAVFAGNPIGHPVADALGVSIAAGSLPRAPFEAMIDARISDLYDDQTSSLNDLEGYFGDTEAAIFQLSALILSGGREVASAEAAGHAGIACGLAKLLTGLAQTPWRAALLPSDILGVHGAGVPPDLRAPSPPLLAALGDLRQTARHHLEKASVAANLGPPAVFSAFLPLATVAGDIARAERRPLSSDGGVGNLRRQWAIWRAARRGRI